MTGGITGGIMSLICLFQDKLLQALKVEPCEAISQNVQLKAFGVYVLPITGNV